ncbi:hypothetical protein IAQ61_011026 [Plenodomus lingam]|uniref:uncharacterized protein n=1 Tax=Leptosphaeria maculans TaxID=5022 RepID=UPI00332A2721|nr:hypothetical protein IAQ61_011026 [Plenodomus lingam]
MWTCSCQVPGRESICHQTRSGLCSASPYSLDGKSPCIFISLPTTECEYSKAKQRSLAHRSYSANPIRRNAGFSSIESLVTGTTQRREAQEEQQQERNGGGGLKIGGVTLGGSGGGITGNGIQLGGGGGQEQGNEEQDNSDQQRQGEQEARNGTVITEGQTAAPETESPPSSLASEKEGEKPADRQSSAVEPEAPARAGTETQPSRAEGEAAKAEAQQEAQQAEENSEGALAMEESERFSEQAGITLDESGNAQNLGGNLGITKGTDGSTSVGGENGIQVA